MLETIESRFYQVTPQGSNPVMVLGVDELDAAAEWGKARARQREWSEHPLTVGDRRLILQLPPRLLVAPEQGLLSQVNTWPTERRQQWAARALDLQRDNWLTLEEAELQAAKELSQ